MDDKLALKSIKYIQITIVDQKDEFKELTISSQELIERIKDCRYQTLCHALTSGVSEIIANFSVENNLHQPAIKFILKQDVQQNVDFSVKKTWKDKNYFEIEKERFEFDTEQEATYILEHVRYLNFKLPRK